ncbi:MAG: GMC oxidoreductase [Synechococcaceae cyanobacterium]
MIIDEQHYDVIIIGGGPAGTAVLRQVMAAGLRTLLLERGNTLPQQDQNVADVDLFRKDRYHPAEQWFGPDGDPFPPQTIYAPGGNSKIWGGVLERMREREFSGLALQEGPAPDWQLRYSDLAPWYDQAETLYRVHGRAGVDPSEPPRSGDFALAPRPIEPCLEALRHALQRQALHPYDLPLSWSDSPQNPSGDAECFGLEPLLEQPSLTLHPGAEVTALHVDPEGGTVKGVEARLAHQSWLFQGHQVVLAAGAVNSAVILLRSASDRHPHGLANGSGQVGRNLMKPQLTAILQRANAPNSGRYAPSLGVTDYYWGDRNVSFPLGSIRNGGGVLQDPLFAESPPLLSLVSRLLPDAAVEWLADRSITWWAMSSVLPDPENRVSLRGDRIQITYLPNNREAHDRLVYRWLNTLKQTEADPLTQVVRRSPIYPRGEAPLSVMGFACGTCRMGSDPASAVVNLEGRCHELANLWIADASVLPSCPSVSPGLTVIANALRIGATVGTAR